MECRDFWFSRHAIGRMFDRGLPPRVVRSVIRSGEVITEYPDDTPFPSCLILGEHQGRAIHVVVAREPESGLCHVVTVYQPDPAVWTDDFKARRHS